MNPLFKVFLDICLLKAGPQDLPASSFLLGLAVLSYVLIGVVIYIPESEFGEALAWTLLDTVLLASLAWVGLQWRGYPKRFGQTFTALAGCGALLGLLGWPLILWLYRSAPPAAPALPSLLLLVLLGWNVVVIGHVVRHALSVPYPIGVLLAVLYVVLSWNLSELLFPGGA